MILKSSVKYSEEKFGTVRGKRADLKAFTFHLVKYGRYHKTDHKSEKGV